MKLLIKIVDEKNRDFYTKHSTYHEGDSGLDLFIVKDETISAGETKLIDLGIQTQLTDGENYFGYLMYPRSSISKTPLRLANSVGLIDAGYTGNLKIALHNTGSQAFTIKRGERYVQLVKPDLSEILFEIVDNHRETSRNSGGFGSTISK